MAYKIKGDLAVEKSLSSEGVEFASVDAVPGTALVHNGAGAYALQPVSGVISHGLTAASPAPAESGTYTLDWTAGTFPITLPAPTGSYTRIKFLFAEGSTGSNTVTTTGFINNSPDDYTMTGDPRAVYQAVDIGITWAVSKLNETPSPKQFDWAPGTSYANGQLVRIGSGLYVCISAHTSTGTIIWEKFQAYDRQPRIESSYPQQYVFEDVDLELANVPTNPAPSDTYYSSIHDPFDWQVETGAYLHDAGRYALYLRWKIWQDGSSGGTVSMSGRIKDDGDDGELQVMSFMNGTPPTGEGNAATDYEVQISYVEPNGSGTVQRFFLRDMNTTVPDTWIVIEDLYIRYLT